MIEPRYPKSTVITKEKVKLALINFLLCHQFKKAGENDSESVSIVMDFAKQSGIRSGFEKQIEAAGVDFTLQDCVDELTALMQFFVSDFGLKGVFYPYTDTGIEKGYLINEIYIDEMIQEMSGELGALSTYHHFSYNDSPWLCEWVGDSDIMFEVGGEDFAIVFRGGNINPDIINSNNDCKVDYDHLEFGRSRGDIHHCAVVTLSWLAIDIFDAECRESMLDLAMSDTNAIAKSKAIAGLLGETGELDYVIAAYKINRGRYKHKEDVKNYLVRESIINPKKEVKLDEIADILTDGLIS